MADKVIGKLTIDISDVEKKIKSLNEWLGNIGAGVDLGDHLTKKFESSLKKLITEAQNAGKEIGKSLAMDHAKKEASDIEKATKAWKEYYAMMTRAQNARNAGRDRAANYWASEANDIVKNVQALREQAEATDAVTKARRNYEASIRSGADRLAADNARERAKAAKEEANAHKEIAKAIDNANKERQKSQNNADKFGNKQNMEAQKALLEHLISLYKKLYAEDAKASKEFAAGNVDEASRHLNNASAIQREIDEIANKNAALNEEAQANEKVAAARERAEKAYSGLGNASEKYNTQEIQKYADALTELYNTQAKFNQDVASGRLYNGTNEYEDRIREIERLKDTAQKAGEFLSADSRRQAEDMDQVTAAVQRATNSYGTLRDAQARNAADSAIQSETDYINRAEEAYKKLTTAINMYNTAKRSKNEGDMSLWQNEINAQMQVLNGISQEISKLDVDAATREKILALLNQANTLQTSVANATGATVNQTTDLSSAVNGLVMRYMSLLAVIRMAKELISATVEYVSEYYDKMNEIQIITGKSTAEVEKLSETYRNLAESMNVSSLDMADAAVYFARQGLSAQVIENRLKNVTMYAKTANIEFKEAAELVTAVVNSMGLVEQEAEDGRAAAQRVADVFLKVGDNAATSGYEIGQAMQKAAASAGAFGVSFEWLASYIATVSETTRQEARTIGTALNTIIARLHQIKQQGYNQEDETKINDVAKALSHVGIALMDQTGEWRNMEDIFVDIADKWDTLDGKTKSYIATTMAGVKQQNVFLALMNDMAKGVENGSRAWELYGLAVDSAGTSEEKFAVYTDSVKAAQERLNVAQEKFYALLQGDTIKGWYDFLTKLVTGITNATKAMRGWNIIIPVVIGLVTTLSIALVKATKDAGTFGAALKTFSLSHPVVLGIMALVTAFSLLSAATSGFTDAAEVAAERYSKAAETLEKSQTHLKEVVSKQKQFNEMMELYRDKGYLTNAELSKYNNLLEDMADISPAAKQAVDEIKNGMADEADVAKTLNDELERTINIEKQISNKALIDKLAGWEAPTDTSQSDNRNSYYINEWEKRGWLNPANGTYTTDDLANAMNLAYREAYDTYSDDINWLQQRMNNVADYGNAVASLFGGKGGIGYQHGSQMLLPAELFAEMLSGDTGGLNSMVGPGQMSSDWEQYLYTKYFGNEATSKALQAQIVQEMNEMVDNAMSIVASDMNPVEQSILRDMMVKAIMGEDMELSTDEYQAMGKKLSIMLYDMMKNGFNMAEFDPGIVLNNIGFDLFGDFFTMYFSDEMIQEASNDPALVNRISEAYAQLFALGFDEQEVWKLYKEITEPIMDDNGKMTGSYQMSIREWANAIEYMRESVIRNMRNEFGSDFGSIIETDTETGKTEVYDWLHMLDIETLKLMDDMRRAGVTSDEFLDMWIESGGDVQVFITLLKQQRDAAAETEKTIADLVKDIKDLKKEYDGIDKIMSGMKNGEGVDINDLLGIAGSHPEILAFTNDISALEQALEDLKRTQGEEVVGNIRKMMETNETVMKNSPFAEYISDEIKTLGDLLNDPAMYESVKAYIDKSIGMILAESGNLEMAGKEWAVSFMNGLFSNANMDLANRPVIDASELTKAGWDNAGDGIATLFSSTYTAGSKGLEWNQDIVVALTPITKDGKVLSPDELDAYMEDLLTDTTDMSGILEKDKNGLGLVIDVSAVADGDFEGATNKMDAFLRLLHLIHDYLYEGIEGEGENESWLSQQVRKVTETMNNDWAKNNGYIEQINALSNALAKGGTEGVQAAMDMWNSYNEEMRKAILQTYPELGQALLEAEKSIDKQTGSEEKAIAVTDKLGKSLDKAAKYANAKNFKSTYDAIQKLQKGTISATDAYEEFNKELKNIEKAEQDVIDAQTKMSEKTELTTDDVSNLASVLGMTAEEVIADFPGALEMFEELKQAGREAFNELNKEATMKILGISEADFSNIKNGLIAVQSDAQATIEMLKATGQWELVTEDLPADMPVFDVVNGQTTKVGTVKATGHQTLLRMKDSNPLARISGGKSSDSKSKKGGGGGGGGGGNTNQMTEVERMLDNMSQINDIQKYQQSYYQAQNKYYEQTGQLQGVIAYSEREIDVLNEQTRALENNVAKIEEYINKKKAELSTLSTGDAAYEEVADDLDKLQKAHQEYTNQLIDNKTAVDQLTKAIEDQQKKIRDMEISLRNTILKAIEDREKRTGDMLNAEIDMENTILNLIQKRYEKERDQIIETTNKKIDALNKERELLDEQLRIRKEQEEAEDKAAKLRELEVKYERILADPTRRKEAQSLKSDIDSLRKEMAWDLAEEEVKAQQDSIDQQITSLEDYIEYIQNYYEDLFEHPQKLIEEMQAIMQKTDAEIIEWLKANDEEYEKSTENTQKKMVDGWQETLNTMRDIIKTYWDEVEWIIEQGDEYIIDFLKENSADYREAGRLQAEAYVDEWMEQLDNLKKAYQSVASEAAAAYATIEKSSGGSKSGGGGGGSGSKGGSKNHGYTFTYNGKEYTNSGYSSADLARAAGQNEIENLAKKDRDNVDRSYPSGGTVYEYAYNKVNDKYRIAKSTLAAYANGGIVDFTGPAWLDGTKSKPESVLNPYQTKLFEAMVSALESMSRISVPGMTNMSGIQMTGGNPVSVGDIIVNVDNLDTDDDYEELADRVSAVLMERIGKTAAIGGLRIRSV